MKKLEKKQLEQISGGKFPQYIPAGGVNDIREAIKWLKEHGYWDQIVHMGKKYGKRAALELTKKYCNENLANEIINEYFPIW